MSNFPFLLIANIAYYKFLNDGLQNQILEY